MNGVSTAGAIFLVLLLVISIAFFTTFFMLIRKFRGNPKAPFIFIALGILYSLLSVVAIAYSSRGEGSYIAIAVPPLWPHMVVSLFFAFASSLVRLLFNLDHSLYDSIMDVIGVPLYAGIWAGIGYLIGLRVKNGRKKNQ